MGSLNVALLEALLSVGISHERARNLVELLERSVDERYGLHAQVLATKRDIAELQTATKRDIAELHTATTREIAEFQSITTREIAGLQAATAREIAGFQAATAREIAELRTTTVREISRVELKVAQLESKVAETKSDLVRWMLAALTAQTALLLGAMRLL